MNIDEEISRLTPRKTELLNALIADRHRVTDPVSDAERILCEEWAAAFGHHVTPLDDFFALGGDSILSLRLASRVHARGWMLRGPQIFAHPTIRALAGELRPVTVAAPAPTALAGLFDVPLTPMQQGMLYQVQTAGRTDVYISQFICSFSASLDLARLRMAWQRLSGCRAALRASVDFDDDGQPVMHIVPDAGGDIDALDWKDWPAGQVAAAVQTLADAERIRGFDLSSPPLMRLALIQQADGSWSCIWTHHHLLLDGWSQLVLLDDLFAMYADPTLELPDDSAALRAFVAAQPNRLSPEAAQYWQTEFTGSTRCSFAPSGLQNATVDCAAGRIPADVLESLEDLARQASTTLAAALEIVWGLVVASIFGRDEAVFGLVNAVRPAALAGVERLAWMCINTTPVRILLGDAAARDTVFARRAAGRRSLQERMGDPLPEVLKACPGAGFGTVLVIENFHRGVEGSAHQYNDALVPKDVRFDVREHYPVICVIAGPQRQLTVDIKVDRHWNVPCDATQLLELWQTAAQLLASDGSVFPGEIAALLRGVWVRGNG